MLLSIGSLCPVIEIGFYQVIKAFGTRLQECKHLLYFGDCVVPVGYERRYLIRIFGIHGNIVFVAYAYNPAVAAVIILAVCELMSAISKGFVSAYGNQLASALLKPTFLYLPCIVFFVYQFNHYVLNNVISVFFDIEICADYGAALV